MITIIPFILAIVLLALFVIIKLQVPSEPTGLAPIKPYRNGFNRVEMPPQDYVVVDIETTGLKAKSCEILEIGAIRYRNFIETDRYHTYIRPSGKIPREVINIHHITWRTVCHAPATSDIITPFLTFVGDDTLVCYNVGFDINFIQTRFELNLDNPVFDVLDFARKMLPYEDNYKLDTLRKKYSLGGQAHSSLGDCEATSKLLKLCLNSSRYEDYLLEQERRKAEQICLAERAQQLRTKKEELKAAMPPRKELNKISSMMTGTSRDYMKTVVSILDNSGFDINELDGEYTDLLRYRNYSFFGVKTTGMLKYVYIDFPPEKITSQFIIGPTLNSEFYDGTRIFVSSPEDLFEIADVICGSCRSIDEALDEALKKSGNAFQENFDGKSIEILAEIESALRKREIERRQQEESPNV